MDKDTKDVNDFIKSLFKIKDVKYEGNNISKEELIEFNEIQRKMLIKKLEDLEYKTSPEDFYGHSFNRGYEKCINDFNNLLNKSGY